MIIIADSGSTKTDWAIVSGRQTTHISTEGINPVHQDDATILHILRSGPAGSLDDRQPDAIHFYGAGCTPAAAPRLAGLLQAVWPEARAEVASDLLGAARALCAHSEGIAAILGTGSNSCLYDGRQITRNIPPLGYILGDEGSGATLGRLFLNALFKEELPASLREEWLSETRQTYADVIEHVYRKPLANRYLASTAPFIRSHLDQCPALRRLVVENFRQFFRKNIAKYGKALPVGAVGSIAHHFADELREAAALEGFQIGRVIPHPIDALVEFHTTDQAT